MADDLSLLFRLKADNAQAKAAINDTRAAVAQLRQSFGPELTQTVTAANSAFSTISDNLNLFVSQRVPLVGGAFIRVTENLRGLTGESGKTEKAIAGVTKSIESIATQSGKTIPQITTFLTKFIQIEGQANRDKEAINFFGAALAQKLIPELESTGTALAEVATESAATGSAFAALAGPIGIAVVAVVAVGVAAVVTAKQLIDLTKSAADFQGKMFDLAQQTGLSVKTLSALEVAAKTTGGELGSITQAVVLFQRQLDDAQDPLSKTAEKFQRLGVDTSDTETALRSAFSALAKMPEGFAQTNAAAELFGARGGKQVLAILKETQGDLDGTIQRLRELGILISEDDARAADILNDQLAVLEFQTRALEAVFVRELIPVLADLARTTGELVTSLRPLISLLGSATGAAARFTSEQFKALSIIVQALTKDYVGLAKSIQEAHDAQQIEPIKVPTVGPVALPGAPTALQSTREAVNQAEAVAAAVKSAVASHGQELDQLFQTGRVTRQQQTNSAIADIEREAKAESDRIDALIAKREEEFKVARDLHGRESEEARSAADDIGKLQVTQLEKQADAQRKISDLRFKALQESAAAERQVAQEGTDLLVKELDRGITALQDNLSREDLARKDSLTTLEQLEQAKIEVQILGLERQKAIGRQTVEEQQKTDAQIRALYQDLDLLRDEQQRRRQERERQLNERTTTLLEATLETQLNILQIRGQALIATENALADLRVKSHEDAARKILKINLDLIDAQIETLKARFTAAKSLPDENESLRQRVELNNQIKILIEQRIAIEAEGNREIEEKRQEDLRNERDYQNDLSRIKQRTADIERDAAEEVIRLMSLHFASRRDIIRARLQLDIADENARHAQANKTIDDLLQENRESKRTAAEKLEAERELNALREAEAERHRLAMQGITDQGKKDEEGADPLGRLGADIETLKEFASVIEESIIPLGEILRGTFLSVADAIGQTVQNWVLLGETGPAVMRKILAQALANIAAEAAVNAIKELALGFATLFFNPAEAAAHFTSAAIWGSIAGVSAVAGRAVAGDLFKPKQSGGATGSGSGSRSSSTSSQPQTVNMDRNTTQVQTVRVEIGLAEGADDMLEAKWINRYQQGGRLRNLVRGDQES